VLFEHAIILAGVTVDRLSLHAAKAADLHDIHRVWQPNEPSQRVSLLQKVTTDLPVRCFQILAQPAQLEVTSRLPQVKL
jgi:hypothetical protein